MKHIRFHMGTAAAALTILAAAAMAQEPPPAQTTPAPTQSEPAAPPAQTEPTPAPVAASPAAMPSRGATMNDVRSKFGAPSNEVPAIGEPPITRWEYPGYVVYFEHDRVLHTVVVKS